MSRVGGVRSLCSVDRLIMVGVVTSLAVAACAASDGAAGPETRPKVQLAAPTSTINTTTTTATAATAGTTTAAPQTTVPLTVSVVADVCESLDIEGFETRRVVLDATASDFAAAGGVGEGRMELATECGGALSRLDGAVEIRTRLEVIDMAEEDGWFPVTLTEFACEDSSFRVTVTNDAAIPLGLHANFAMYLDGDREDAVQSSAAPLVVWSIEPGASEVVSGTFAGYPGQQVYCEFQGQVFDADASSADASIGEATHPELTGDDPAAWFPALAEIERSARTSGDIDLAALTADVRSMSYDEVALAISEGVLVPSYEIVEVCERGRSQPDPDHIGFVYLRRDLDDTGDGQPATGDTRLSHGLFRRGADGQWRWLSTVRYFESTLTDDCRGVDPDLADIAINGL